MAFHVGKDTFAHLVEEALFSLPPQFANFLDEVPVEIRDRPNPAQLRSLGLDNDHLLLGLYVGRPRTQRSVMDSGNLPDVIYIFQNNIEQVSHSRQQLIDQVRTTVLHEIGHHFGMSEEDLDALGYG